MTTLTSPSIRGRYKLDLSKLDRNLKLVLSVLLSHHNDRTCQCNPSLARIMGCADLSRNTVRKALQELEALPPACEPKKAPQDNSNKPLKSWSQRNRPDNLTPKAKPAATDCQPTTPATPMPPVAPECRPTAPEPSANSPLDSTTIQRINAQRQANGKRHGIHLEELHSEAQKAGISPLQAAEWILQKPTRNFFKADYHRTEDEASQPISTASKPARDPVLVQLEQDAQNACPPSAEVRAHMQRILNTTPTAPPRVLMQPSAPIAMGAGANIGWAQQIIERYTQGEAVSHAAISNAAQALRMPMAEIKARRAKASTTWPNHSNTCCNL